MERYESYKDSGVKWLGEIPGHWEVKRFRFLFSENKSKNTKLKVTKQLQFNYGEIVPKERQDVDNESVKIISNYTIVREKDIMINGLNLNYDFVSQRVAMVRESGIITSAYISLRSKDNVNSCYYNYFLKAMDYRKMFHGMGSGIRLTLAFENLKNLFFPYPSYNEQTAIANYLDSVTSKIDEAISQQQKMIDLLNERKQIIIQNAVTKGLDPNVKMKDSGVEWIGEIPEDWEIKRLRNYLRIFSEKGYPNCQLLSVTREKGVILRDKEDLEENHNFVPDDLSGYKHINKGDFVINKMKSWQGSYGLSDFDGIVSPAYFTCKLNGIDKKFFSVAVRSKAYVGFFNRYSKGIRLGQWDLDPSSMKEIPFIEPPIIEQKKIYDFIYDKQNKINSEVDKCNQMISLLQERKQIIINDVVTGKVKVV